MNLYDISDRYLTILNHFNKNEGEIGHQDICLLKELDALSDNIVDKAVNIASYIKNIEAEHAQVSKARKDMQAREKKLMKKSEWLEAYLKCTLRNVGISEITKSPQFVIRLKKCPESVNIYDETKIPDDYKEIKEVISVDKTKLKKAMQDGAKIDGAELQQNIRLEIK